MRDYLEKYLIIQQSFPNKAGKIAQLLEAQKRLITKLAKQKQTDEVKSLLAVMAENYDVTSEFLQWNKEVLQGVLNDAEHLAEGAKCRNIIQEQSELLAFYMDNDLKAHEINTMTARLSDHKKDVQK